MSKLSDQYIDAAEWLFLSSKSLDGDFYHRPACLAIEVNGTHKTSLRDAFRKVFKPHQMDNSEYWFGNPWSRSSEIEKERRDHRTFALLLMSELAKDQQL